MTIEMFEEFTIYPRARLLEFSIPDEQSKLLACNGLPTWCAPNMYFGALGEPEVLLPVIEFDQIIYLGLGEDRNEAVIGLSLKEYSVWVIPDASEPAYMARNVIELSQALYHFQSCINSAVENDSTAYTQNRIPLSCLEPFLQWAKEENQLLVQAGSFWHSVLLWLGVPNNSLNRDPVSGSGCLRAP